MSARLPAEELDPEFTRSDAAVSSTSSPAPSAPPGDPSRGCHLLPFATIFRLPDGSQWGIVAKAAIWAKPFLLMSFPRFSALILKAQKRSG